MLPFHICLVIYFIAYFLSYLSLLAIMVRAKVIFLIFALSILPLCIANTSKDIQKLKKDVKKLKKKDKSLLSEIDQGQIQPSEETFA